jgi:hypothetical protein
MRLSLGIAAIAATFAIASPALAQSIPVASSTAPAVAKGVVLLPLTLSNTRPLDFGTVVASTTAGNDGTVIIDPDTGSRSVTGGVLAVANYPGSSALFQGAGDPGQDVSLTLTAPSVLVNQSNNTKTINVLSMAMDNGGGAATVRTIDSSGAFSVAVGGEFEILANTFPGLYQADFDVTAEYY